MRPIFVKGKKDRIKKITNFEECFKFVKQAGRGGFCSLEVYEFENKLYALKFIKYEKKNEAKCMKNFEREYCIHKSVNLITENSPILHDHFIYEKEERYLVLLMQYVEGGNIHGKKLEGEDINDFCLWLSTTIDSLHKNDICHGDIKPSNILKSGNNYYLVDFGVSSYLSSKIKLRAGMGLCGTKSFFSPQNINYNTNKIEYDVRKNDVWSMGVTFFILIEGRSPWAKKEVFEDILSTEYKIPFKKCTPFYRDLISQMLNHNSEERISLPQVIEKIENNIPSV